MLVDKNITINCGWGEKVWEPIYRTGGSEEQAILLAELLLDFDIVSCVNIFNTIQAPKAYCVYPSWKEVKYLPGNTFSQDTTCDVYFAWRDWRLCQKRYAPKQILLCHDIPVHAHWPYPHEIESGALDHIDYVNVLNEYHKELYINAGCPPEKILLIPIIIYPNRYIGKVKRDMNKCIWLSHPDRGLHKFVNEYWPTIKESCPQATLQPCWWDETDMDKFIPSNVTLGIMPTKLLDHNGVDRELASSYLYPYSCTFGAEISPASCLKSLNSGLEVVVIPQGGIRATMGEGNYYVDDSSFIDRVVQVLNSNNKVDRTCAHEQLIQHRPEAVKLLWEKIICE